MQPPVIFASRSKLMLPRHRQYVWMIKFIPCLFLLVSHPLWIPFDSFDKKRSERHADSRFEHPHQPLSLGTGQYVSSQGVFPIIHAMRSNDHVSPPLSQLSRSISTTSSLRALLWVSATHQMHNVAQRLPTPDPNKLTQPHKDTQQGLHARLPTPTPQVLARIDFSKQPSQPVFPESLAVHTTVSPSAMNNTQDTGTPYIPILMYHYVREVDVTLDPLGYRLSVLPTQFAAQLNWLARQGYTTVRMETVVACLRGERICPPKTIALTFDDGYMDAYQEALPLLQQYKFVATFYIVTSFVGQQGYMGWQELAVLRDAGMEIGAHSVNHVNLTALGRDQALSEIINSRELLAQQLNVPIKSFCYPAGKFDMQVESLVREAGYDSATTTFQSWDETDLFALPRLRVSSEIGEDGFRWLVQTYTPM